MIVDDIMTRDVVTVGLDDSVKWVRAIFDERRFHHLIVTEGGKVVGVLSDRDLLKHISPFIGKMGERPQDIISLEKRVHQVMSRALISVKPGTDVCDAAALLVHNRVGCLPVIDDAGRCAGIVSLRDLLRALASIAGCEIPPRELGEDKTAQDPESPKPSGHGKPRTPRAA